MYNNYDPGIDEVYRYQSELCNSDKIKVPQYCIAIDAGCFEGFEAESIELHNMVTNIGNSAFKNCRNLKSIIIPNGVKVIPAHCFAGNSSIEEVTLPPSVVYVSPTAFNNCENLKSIRVCSDALVFPKSEWYNVVEFYE